MALKNSQLSVVSCGIALQAFILVLLDTFVAKAAGLPAGVGIWVAFQAWAVYFLAGCNPMGGLKAFIGYATGILASIIIIELMGAPGISALPAVAGMNLVMATAVAILVIPAIFLSEKLKNMIPALFIGSGAFFALTAIMGLGTEATYLDIIRAELVYCAYGLVFGYITVFWRSRYEASLNKDKP